MKRACVLLACWVVVAAAITAPAFAQGNSGRARRDLDRAYQLEGEGKTSEAWAALSAAHRADAREFRPGDWVLASRLSTRQRRLDDALDFARRAWREQPDADSLDALCSVLERREEYPEARDLVRQAADKAGQDPGWPYPNVWRTMEAFYQATNENPAVRRSDDASRFLILATKRDQEENDIWSLWTLVDTYNDLGQYKEARALLSRWIADGRPGPDEAKKHLEWLLDEVGIEVECFTFTLRPDDPMKDISDLLPQLGGWDVMVPAPCGFRQTVALVTNAKSWTKSVDRAENEHYLLVPQDPTKPVDVCMVSKYNGRDLDIERETEAGYEVPAKYAMYLGPSPDGHIDPTTPLARALAASLKGPTVADTIRRTYWWWQTNVEYGGVMVEAEMFDRSENTLRQRKGVCHDMSQAAAALLRANGIATRLIRWPTHTWPEVWFPKSGWMPLQCLLRHNTFRMIGGALYDGQIIPQELAGKPLAKLYRECGLGIDLWGPSGPTIKRLGLFADDVPIEQVIKDSNLAGQLLK